MLELDELPISVVIPTYNNKKSFANVLDSVLTQTIKPRQVIVIDSSDNYDIENYLHKCSEDIEIIFKKVERSFPGRARNLGVQIASQKYLAFLDSKTIPDRNWLSSSLASLKDYDVILGSVNYQGTNALQKLICASIYGDINIEHISGTLISKSTFLKIGFFDEETRAGEDLDWKRRLKESEFNYYVPAKANAVYSEIPSNLIFHMKRAFIYQMHSAFLDIQQSTRVVFLSLFLILLATLVPSWNDLIMSYGRSSLFVPHVTKFFLLFVGIFIILGVINLKLFPMKEKKRRSLIFLINFSLFVCLFIVVYNWNTAVSNWNENSPFFVPHITKIYLVSLLVLSFIVRGIIFPIKRGVKKKYLFPFRWFAIGLIGLALDISKSPGYFTGALVGIYRKLKSQVIYRNKNESNMY